jgi:uncharacterized protein (TIGR03000 family)
MFCLRRPITWAATLATVAVLVAVRPAPAQSSAGYYYETFRYGYNPGYYARRYTSVPAGYEGPHYGAYRTVTKTTPSPVGSSAWLHYAAATPAQGSGSAPMTASGARGAPAESLTVAQIELRVPAGALVWLDGVPTRQTGAVRLFVSPPLTVGKEYSYEVRVTWKEGDGDKAEKRELTVRAGDRLSASFPADVSE